MASQRFWTVATLLAGFGLGFVARTLLFSDSTAAIAQTELHTSDLHLEIEAIKGKLPDQSHAMQDVGYHFSNLWFAGQNHHWDLATFYWSETRSHLHWAVRIIPVRKDKAGVEIKLVDILGAMENGPLKQLGEAIAAKDSEAFEKAYRVSAETCYACHKASDKPFLRIQIPTEPESPIINFNPAADWPK